MAADVTQMGDENSSRALQSSADSPPRGCRNVSCTMNNKPDGTDRAGVPDLSGEDRLRAVLDVRIMPRGRRWRWQVCNQHGVMLMRGWETSRALARYQGYSALLLLLRANCVQAPLRRDRTPERATEPGTREPGTTEKGRPVARTAFPVSRLPHISGRFQDFCTGGLSPGRVLLGGRCSSGRSRSGARSDAVVSHLRKMATLSRIHARRATAL
jgi:hypothetical protein